MQQQVFCYFGFSLAKLLELLCDILDKRIKHNTTELVRMGGAVKNPRPGTVLPERIDLQNQLLTDESKLEKARLWLSECQRTPLRRFKLDFDDLRWVRQP